MLEFGDSVYYIDLKNLDKLITISNNTKKENVGDREVKQTFNDKNELVMTEIYEKTVFSNKEIDVSKYDILKTFIEYIIDYRDETDDTLGADRALAQAPLGYKIVFNTLLNEGIIKEKP